MAVSYNNAGLQEALDLECPGDHSHAVTEGSQTELSAKYPPKMDASAHDVYRVAKPLGGVSFELGHIVKVVSKNYILSNKS